MTVIRAPRDKYQYECWRLVADCPVCGFTKAESKSVSYWATKEEAVRSRIQLNASGCGGHPCTPSGHRILPPKKSNRKLIDAK